MKKTTHQMLLSNQQQCNDKMALPGNKKRLLVSAKLFLNRFNHQEALYLVGPLKAGCDFTTTSYTSYGETAEKHRLVFLSQSVCWQTHKVQLQFNYEPMHKLCSKL